MANIHKIKNNLEFLERGIIQEFYEINSDITADLWVNTDIIENYGNDYRIHIIRTDLKNVPPFRQVFSFLHSNFLNFHHWCRYLQRHSHLIERNNYRRFRR